MNLRLVGGVIASALLAACGSGSGSRANGGPAGGDSIVDSGSPDAANLITEAGPTIMPPLIMIDGGGGPTKPPPGNRVVKVGAVPTGIEDSFTNATAGTGSGPVLAYPTPGTMFPPNLARILFQWTAPSGDVFHLHFDSGKGTLDVYTDGVHDTCAKAGTGGRCWESSADTLMPYLDAAAGGQVDFQIAALDSAMPGARSQSPAYSVSVAPHQVGGAIYYWSTTVQGIRRGTLDGRDAADYLTPVVAKGQCVACHTLSRSGKHLSIALPGDLLGLADVVDTVPPITFGPSSQGFPGENIAASWATFNPDESQIVIAGQGVLSVRDARTARAIGALIALPAGMTGSMPDWAPDGRHLVFAASMGATPDRVARHLRGSSIAWLSAAGEGFAGLEIIAQSKGVVSATCVGQESYANPMFSPDSKWLAFSRADCESEADPTAEIMIAAAAPNAPRYALIRANNQVGDQV